MTASPSSYRLSDHTNRQISELAAQMGTTATTVVTIAIDRMYREFQQQRQETAQEAGK